MSWSAAATKAAVKARRTAMKTRIAAGKQWCAHHHDGAGAWLPVSRFPKSAATSSGTHAWCKRCKNQAQREKYASDPAARAAAQARAAARRAQAKASKATEAAAKIDAAITVASDPRADPRDVWATLRIIPPERLPEVAAARAAAFAAKVQGQRDRAETFALWCRGRGPAPSPFLDPDAVADRRTKPRAPTPSQRVHASA